MRERTQLALTLGRALLFASIGGYMLGAFLTKRLDYDRGCVWLRV